MRLNKQKGFTLIELLVVVAIISLLSSIVYAALNSARAKGRDAKRVTEIKQIQNAIELYRNDNNSYPTVTCTGGWAGYYTGYESCWATLQTTLSSYISRLPLDPMASLSPQTVPSIQASPAVDMAYWYISLGGGSSYAIMVRPENNALRSNGICPGAYNAYYCLDSD